MQNPVPQAPLCSLPANRLYHALRLPRKLANRRVLRRMERIDSLPLHQQNHLLKTIDGFLKGAGVAV